jgi:hypothetical protein
MAGYECFPTGKHSKTGQRLSGRDADGDADADADAINDIHSIRSFDLFQSFNTRIQSVHACFL